MYVPKPEIFYKSVLFLTSPQCITLPSERNIQKELQSGLKLPFGTTSKVVQFISPVKYI